MLNINKSNFDSQKFDLLVHRIAQTKENVKVSEDRWLLKGSRWSDNERIAYMICGFIVEETVDQTGEWNYEAANSKFLSLDTAQIDPYIIRGVIESASADYYYTYEKEY